MNRTAAARVVWAAILALGALAGPTAYAQVSSINSAKISAREFNDDPTSNFTPTNNYPTLISLSDQSVDKNGAAGGFANRHVWRFSNDGGATAFSFTNDSFFQVSTNLTLTTNNGAGGPRREAGYLFDTAGGQGQFIVNSDAGEIVAFGGPLPFYSFNAANGLSYTPGATITLGLTYFLDANDGMRKIIYTAGGVSSPAIAFTNNEQGIINGTTLGGYLQVPINAANPDNGGTADFANISIAAVPEPASLCLCVGGLGLLALRRRKCA